MQAVILAAGLSTRMHPLTLTKPKPLISVANKPLIEHTLDTLVCGRIDEAIIVIGYKGEQIKKRLGDEYKRIKLTYVEQKEQKGPGNALWLAKEHIKDSFFLLPADDYYSKKDIEIMSHFNNALLVSESSSPERFGVIEEKYGYVRHIEEKPEKPQSNKVSTMCFVLQKKFFENFPKSHDLSEAFNQYAKDEYIVAHYAWEKWIPLAYPWDLLTLNEYILSQIKRITHLAGNEINMIGYARLWTGQNTVIKGATIEGNVLIGENCVIGPYAYLRGPVSIGDNCRIGHCTEVKNSIIMNNTNIAHRTGILDSIVGEGCNFGAGTECANLRHDGQEIKVNKDNEFISTDRRKFGFIMSDRVKTAIGTKILPGKMFWPDTFTDVGEVVRKNKI